MSTTSPEHHSALGLLRTNQAIPRDHPAAILALHHHTIRKATIRAPVLPLVIHLDHLEEAKDTQALDRDHNLRSPDHHIQGKPQVVHQAITKVKQALTTLDKVKTTQARAQSRLVQDLPVSDLSDQVTAQVVQVDLVDQVDQVDQEALAVQAVQVAQVLQVAQGAQDLDRDSVLVLQDLQATLERMKVVTTLLFLENPI